MLRESPLTIIEPAYLLVTHTLCGHELLLAISLARSLTWVLGIFFSAVNADLLRE